MSGEEGGEGRATASEIAYAIAHGKPIPGTAMAKSRKSGHVRTASAPDATSGAQESGATLDRMAMGWKPQLTARTQSETPTQEQDTQAPLAESPSVAGKTGKIVQRASATDFLSRFSPDTSPDDDAKRPRYELDRELAAISNVAGLPVRRSRSEEPMSLQSGPSGSGGAANPAEAAATMLSRMPQDLRMQKNRVSSAGEPLSQSQSKRTTIAMSFEDVKNKPLPKIAVL